MTDNTTENIPSENIKVSVILPVWNPGPGIDRCIASLREQTLKEIEMIFVDDRGTDDSMARVRAAAEEDPRIRVIVNPENIGPGPSRNAGIEAARGDYLLFADPDDYLDLSFLEELYREASAKDLAIVKGCLVFECEDGTPIPWGDVNGEILRGLADGEPLFTLLCYQHQSVLTRRQILLDDHIRYGNSRCGEDKTFLLRLCCADPSFGICRTSGAYHYVNRGMSSRNIWNEKMLMDRLDGFRERVDHLLVRGFDISAEKYISGNAGYLLGVHSRASVVPALKKPAAAFLAGLREQMLRCPWSQSTVDSDVSIRGLVVFGVNLLQTPFRFLPFKPGTKEHLIIIRRWFNFLCGHPGEIPAFFGVFVRTVGKNLKALLG